MRRLASEPSSRSVTRTAYFTGVPGKKNVLLPATSSATCGGSLPAVIGTCAVLLAPCASVTVSVAV